MWQPAWVMTSSGEEPVSTPGRSARKRTDDVPTRSVTGPGAATQGEGPQPLRARRDPLEDTRSQGCLGPRAPRSGVRHRSRLGWMVASYGWRVLAIPVLVVLTVLAVLDTIRYSPTPTSTTAAAGAAGGLRSHNAGSAGPPISGPVADGSFDPSTAAGTLPEGGLFPTTGAGTWHVVPGTTPQVGVGTTSVNTYTVEVENGMDTTAFGGDEDVASVVEHRPAGLDSRRTIRLPTHRLRNPHCPDQPHLPGHRAPRHRVRLPGPDGDLVFQRHHPPGGPQRGAVGARRGGCAAHCLIRATSVPTGPT